MELPLLMERMASAEFAERGFVLHIFGECLASDISFIGKAEDRHLRREVGGRDNSAPYTLPGNLSLSLLPFN